MLESVLLPTVSGRAHTSPHLVSVEERIRIGGEAIDRADLEPHLDRLAPMTDLTFFETITAAAFSPLPRPVSSGGPRGRNGRELGRDPGRGERIAGITNVGSDHAEWLGRMSSIARATKGRRCGRAEWAVIGPDFDPELVPALGAPHGRGRR